MIPPLGPLNLLRNPHHMLLRYQQWDVVCIHRMYLVEVIYLENNVVGKPIYGALVTDGADKSNVRPGQSGGK